VKFVGLLHAARFYQEKGRALWNKATSGLRDPPDFGKYGMSLNRFHKLMKSAPSAHADYSKHYEAPWWRVSRLIAGFNENRKRTILKSDVMTIDESMSAFQPRTTKCGGLPNISFIKRKPKPLGTEFKNICDGVHGCSLSKFKRGK
jgi:hypothetical protein